MTISIIFYKNLYNNQIEYILSLLDHQAQIVGSSIDNTNNNFLSDLNKIGYMDDLAFFFTDEGRQKRAIENIKLFYSKYEDFISGIKIYDNNKNEFSIRKDQGSGEWLQQQFILHVQGEIFRIEKMETENNRFIYYLPVIKNNEAIANVAVTVDYFSYFESVFYAFSMEQYEWQWVLDDGGNIIYKNSLDNIEYEGIDDIVFSLLEGSVGNIRHNSKINGESQRLISSFYSTQLLQRDLAIVFSAPTQSFHTYVMINSIVIISLTLLLVILIIFIFTSYYKEQEAKIKKLVSSEKMLYKMIDEMPIGIIIYNADRIILKANNIAAKYYSCKDEKNMEGNYFPEIDFEDVPQYFSKYLGLMFTPDQLVIIKQEDGEKILIRNTVQVNFKGEPATLEILNDVTLLETARRKEAEANISKAEFFKRINFELRGPLNGIIGMTDLLAKYHCSEDIKEIVSLLKSSSEHFMKILDEILDFSNIQTGKMVLDIVPFNFKEEIDYGISYLRNLIEDKPGIILEYDIDDKIPEKIISDQYRLRQAASILMNFIAGNIETGKIFISCKLIDNKKGLVTILFEVLDTGESYHQEELDEIFNNPIAGELRVTDKNRDTIFANILSKQLIEKMGGKFSISSPSGLDGNKGVKISVMLEAYSNVRIEKNFELREISSLDEIKTLVLKNVNVRDEESIADLHKLGLDISVTTYNANTVDQIKNNARLSTGRYDLIVLFDYEDFSGFDIAKSLWDNELSVKYNLLMISYNDQQDNYLRCVEMGVDHYLPKPYDMAKLEATIRDCFPSLEKPQEKKIVMDSSNINVLLVEDDIISQNVIGTIFKNMGISFDTANSGEEGLNKAREKKYDLIFMDLFMPDLNGFDASKKIMERDKSALIVAITAGNMPEVAKKVENSGMKELITKPLRVADIEKIFDKYFRHHES